jgi:hypothetical protein
MKYPLFEKIFFIVVAALLLSACASMPQGATGHPAVAYVAQDNGSLLARHAPIIVPQDQYKTYNQIGRPTARYDAHGKKEQIYIDPAAPVFYTQQKTFQTSKGQYTNLIYRVHFTEVPFQFFPFNITAGKNGGLLTVITLDSAKQPVLVTTVHTCGCYVAIMPTGFLPVQDYPETWDITRTQSIYGENLPVQLAYPDSTNTNYRPTIFLRDGTHRVMDVKIGSAETYNPIITPIEPAEKLKNLPLGMNNTTSFYVESGLRQGYVKESFKPFELALMSWWVLDPFVGVDKEFSADPATGPVFYTSLPPWNRKASDMRNFAKFLAFWGWRL